MSTGYTLPSRSNLHFLHLGTLVLSPECQSAGVSEIKTMRHAADVEGSNLTITDAAMGRLSSMSTASDVNAVQFVCHCLLCRPPAMHISITTDVRLSMTRHSSALSITTLSPAGFIFSLSLSLSLSLCVRVLIRPFLRMCEWWGSNAEGLEHEAPKRAVESRPAKIEGLCADEVLVLELNQWRSQT